MPYDAICHACSASLSLSLCLCLSVCVCLYVFLCSPWYTLLSCCLSVFICLALSLSLCLSVSVPYIAVSYLISPCFAVAECRTTQEFTLHEFQTTFCGPTYPSRLIYRILVVPLGITIFLWSRFMGNIMQTPGPGFGWAQLAEYST